MTRFERLFGHTKPLIGMIHLAPLPDYPQSPGMSRVIERALVDLQSLEAAGFDGVLVENEYDQPHRVVASPATVSAMIEVTRAVVHASTRLVIGCEILLNDPIASLDVAQASGAGFIRTDYFVDRMSRPEFGEFAIDPDGLLEHRKRLGCEHVLVMADIQVKYARMLTARPLSDSAREACGKGADAIVVTGTASGDAPCIADIVAAKAGAVDGGATTPVVVGSGLDRQNAGRLLAAADGAIVGTALMRGGSVDPGAALDIVVAARGDACV
ncbi:MAG: BtpA/SgcQ family protein [Gammaproteobacteria bacterium]|nr:BtpA/SgcQ family protein [Gammaproteobacteria bacterium]